MIQVEPDLSYSIGQTAIIAFDENNKIEGTVTSY